MRKKRVISIDLSIGKYKDFHDAIVKLAEKRDSSYVCVANVHMCIEAFLKKDFAKIINNATLVTPDGMPLCKSLYLLYGIKQERVAGMDLLPDILKEAASRGLSVFFYGSSPDVLAKIEKRIKAEHPDLKIAGLLSPPFRRLTDSEEKKHMTFINSSGAQLLMVALGCPKQEIWMAKHYEKINAVMVGVGGAFPVYAKVQNRAPVWMQRSSLEWFFRLMQEPRRLLKRYLVTNLLFITLLLWQLMKKYLLRIST